MLRQSICILVCLNALDYHTNKESNQIKSNQKHNLTHNSTSNLFKYTEGRQGIEAKDIDSEEHVLLISFEGILIFVVSEFKYHTYPIISLTNLRFFQIHQTGIRTSQYL